jgi:hypothetical protein
LGDYILGTYLAALYKKLSSRCLHARLPR